MKSLSSTKISVIGRILFLTMVWSLWVGGGTASAFHPVSNNPAEVGELGPLIPFHKDAIHAGLAWTHKTSPKICFWMRPAEYQGTDLVDPNVGLLGTLKEIFSQLVYGFGFSTGPHGLDESVTTRIKADIPSDNGLCFDLTHPNAFENTGKFNVADLTEADFALNAAAFSNAGHSRGLNYNIFSRDRWRWLTVGGSLSGGMMGSATLGFGRIISLIL